MKRADREKLAATLGRIAEQAGAIVTVEHESRSTRVACTFPRVRVSFDLDGLHGGGILANWYGATDDLMPGPWFDSVNPCHHRKATMYGADDVEFAAKFYRACRAVADGRAFAGVPA